MAEGEDVLPSELWEGENATTSAARATTVAGEGEDNAMAATATTAVPAGEDTVMGDASSAEKVEIPAEGVPAPKGDTPIPF